MIVNRAERHQIKRGHFAWKLIDELCYKSKNLYNYANYIVRKEYIDSGKYKNYYEMAGELKSHELFEDFGSQVSQQTLRILDRNWKSFFVAIKDWSKNPSKYLGRPRLPNYKDGNGRFPTVLSNIQFRIEDGYLRFSWKPLKILNGTFKTNVGEGARVTEVRFVPRGSSYVMEIVYRVDIPDIKEKSSRIIGIDMGVNNLATISNNIGQKPIIVNGRIIKSMNRYYNKKRAKMQNDLIKKNGLYWSTRLQQLNDKYMNKVDCHMHKISKYVVNWCIDNEIDTIVIGKNTNWKQNVTLGKKTNQLFTQIPHARLIDQLVYKAEDKGIRVILTEESYTSGTSFLDNEMPIKTNYNKKRRIKRGLFKSNSGECINADLNGAYQIMKKVFPNVFSDGIEGVHLHPVRINV